MELAGRGAIGDVPSSLLFDNGCRNFSRPLDSGGPCRRFNLLTGRGGVWGLGDGEVARRGLRIGSFEPIGAAREECERAGVVNVALFLANGLGVERLRGLWPTSKSLVTVDPFHLGR